MLRSLACVLVVLLAPPSLGLPAYLVRPLPSREELRLRPSGRPFTISVEGNVGAGKSTLLKYFQKVASAPRPGPHLTVMLYLCSTRRWACSWSRWTSGRTSTAPTSWT